MAGFKIVILPGDGIGPEVTNHAVQILDIVGKKYQLEFNTKDELIGGVAIDKFGQPLPESTLQACKNADAVLLGAVGGQKWDSLPGNLRPEAGLLGIRSGLGLYANLRPAVIYDALRQASPLKEDIVKKGVDVMVVRELTGGMYFGEKGRLNSSDGIEAAYDTELYSTTEVERITRIAFGTALKRRKKVTSVDKANVLESSRLWREVVIRVSKEYPDVVLDHMYVDNAAMQIVRNPAQFDVIVTSNIFGDILSDEASMITGSIGMLPSASLGKGTLGLYEPVHGSAPDIAGQDKANPIAAILSVAMMMKYSFNLEHVSNDIERAVVRVLDKGYRTGDIASPGTLVVGTSKMGQLIQEEIKNN